MTDTRRYSVTGMSCGHCESAIRAEVEQLPGVSGLEVSADTGRLEIAVTDDAALTDETVLAAVDEAGYDAVRQL
ncbi:cation transporter [Nesterenkonia sp. AY15]|uniref:heavy-metal-associated domain-containing protein n=1 Tax=unclassified Nesterenkonia TaxID=2629769 RepID=UPI001F4D242C|nr:MULTISPECIES: cation transporter [unclassified Nesterenkonia]MCH8562230.1 cation transporter [Nesterenkonia sp. YGD6]MCH8569866.1 cation transporter [Nesterenkonia sp. AY15]